MLAPLFVLAIPLIDLAQVSLFRTLKKRPFWIGDMNHLSHRLNRAGFTKANSVLILWAGCGDHRWYCLPLVTADYADLNFIRAIRGFAFSFVYLAYFAVNFSR